MRNLVSDKRRVLINLGCGPDVRQTDWLDCDASWNLRLHKLPRWLTRIVGKIFQMAGRELHEWPDHVLYVNLRKRFPFESGSVDAIYGSHVWEHLYHQEAIECTRECFRVLKPTGVLRIVVPDLKYFCGEYVSSTDPGAADILMRKLMMRSEQRPGIGLFSLYDSLFELHQHKWMYDASSLSVLLKSLGFEEVKEKAYLDSLVPEIAQIESAHRVSRTEGIAVECMKPAKPIQFKAAPQR